MPIRCGSIEALAKYTFVEYPVSMRLNAFLGGALLLLAGWFYFGNPMASPWLNALGPTAKHWIGVSLGWEPYTSIVMVVVAVALFITIKPYD